MALIVIYPKLVGATTMGVDALGLDAWDSNVCTAPLFLGPLHGLPKPKASSSS
ncbi:hypothetical protein FRB96_007989, partial [Tulasnella sp. 330]